MILPDNYKSEGDAICETLIEEIAWAQTWHHIQQARLAILTVRRMSGNLSTEAQLHNGGMKTANTAS